MDLITRDKLIQIPINVLAKVSMFFLMETSTRAFGMKTKPRVEEESHSLMEGFTKETLRMGNIAASELSLTLMALNTKVCGGVVNSKEKEAKNGKTELLLKVNTLRERRKVVVSSNGLTVLFTQVY